MSAAQIRYVNEEGAYSTLYEVPYDEEKFGAIPALSKAVPYIKETKGLNVLMWQEKGLLMVFVFE